jgi:hypothetical protein
MIPVNNIEDTPVNRKTLLNYLTDLQYTKLFMLGSDATNNSQMGMNYDTGYFAAITELKIQIERFNDLNNFITIPAENDSNTEEVEDD